MVNQHTVPYGFWPSPISAELLTAQAVKISDPQACNERLYWLETRPHEKGRNVLVCDIDGQRTDVLPSPHSIRTRAQEYGGSSYLVIETGIFYVLDADQRIYFRAHDTQESRVISPEGHYRYADFCYDNTRHRLIAIRENYAQESHSSSAHHPTSDIIAIDLHTLQISILATGADFYSNPRLSPNGKHLSYLRWNHPQMPWDGTECICATLNTEGTIEHEQVVAGGLTESIFQPQWSPSGDLFFVSDRSNWWNIYRWNGKESVAVFSSDAEFATPQWVFGMSTYGFLTAQEILCCHTRDGQWQLGVIHIDQHKLTPIATGFRDISAIHCYKAHGYFLAASATNNTQLWCFSQQGLSPVTPATTTISSRYIATPQSLWFNTRDGEKSHGFFYPPTNTDVQAPTDSLPPLIVMCHGGPTGATESSLNVKIQFWTSRGFAVFDINYRGSTGFGRRYRDRLKNNWGITDVMDVCSGAEYLIAKGVVDPTKIAIRGSSAGGYTTLAALTFSNTFKAGASLYGIGDLEALAKDTHKFEAHYLDSLIEKYPEQRDVYQARSPIHHIAQLNCPVIFLQGLMDKVVPPSQAEAMVHALRAKGITTEYITFAEEGHGFRQANNIQQAINAELAFYQQIFGGN